MQGKKKNVSAIGGVSPIELLRLLLSNWYWYVISITLCLGIAIFQVKSVQPIYRRTATVLIQGNNTPSAATVFAEVDILNRSSSVENEILIFKSKRLMLEVARKLHLDVSYALEGIFRDWELYTESPIQVTFLDASENESRFLWVTPISKKEVMLSHLGGNEQSPKMKIALNDTTNTALGRILVSPTLSYSQSSFNIPVKVSKRNLESVAWQLNANLEVVAINTITRVLAISLNDVSGQRAADVINTLIDVYAKDVVQDKNKVAVNTADFINERLMIIEKELSGVDYELAESKNLAKLSGSESAAAASSKYNERIIELHNQLSLVKYVRAYIVDPAKATELIPSNTGISDINIEGLINEYNSLLLKRNKLIENSSEKNPVVKDLLDALAASKQNMIRTIDNFISALQLKVDNAALQESRAKQRLAAIPGQQRYALSIERQQKIKESLYLYLLNKREENALSQSVSESKLHLLDPAMGSNVPIAPASSRIIMMGLVLGLCIPTGIIYMMALLDSRIKNGKQIEANLSVPFLGEIPFYKRSKTEKHKVIVVNEESQDSITEAFRIVRTNLNFMMTNNDKKSQVLMITSLTPNAGKTFMTCNLGMVLALTGKKVVLVDLDLRKGSLSSQFASHPIGVTNYLSGEVNDLSDLLQTTEVHPNLNVIHKGPFPPNPAELLLSERLDLLTEELKKQFDYIILDNVPSNMVADAVIVNRLADVTLYLVRSGKIEKKMLPEIEELYETKRFKNMAIILNGVDEMHKGYGYGSGYGYGYGYGYGHHHKKKNFAEKITTIVKERWFDNK